MVERRCPLPTDATHVAPGSLPCPALTRDAYCLLPSDLGDALLPHPGALGLGLAGLGTASERGTDTWGLGVWVRVKPGVICPFSKRATHTVRCVAVCEMR